MGIKGLLTAALVLACAAGAAGAQTLFGQRSDFATLSLHSGWRGDDLRRVAGLRLELAPGWKTYWREPGESGVPPQFDWSRSENLASVEIDWPTPVVFDSFGARAIGYRDRMVLPLTLTPVDPSRPIELRLAFSYGVCGEICVPAHEEIALTIAPDAAENGARMIRAALRDRPVDARAGGVADASCSVEGAGERRTFAAALNFDSAPTTAPVIVVEGPEGVWFGPVESRLENGAVVAEGEVRTDAGRWIDRSDLTLTLLSDSGGVALSGCAAAG